MDLALLPSFDSCIVSDGRARLQFRYGMAWEKLCTVKASKLKTVAVTASALQHAAITAAFSSLGIHYMKDNINASQPHALVTLISSVVAINTTDVRQLIICRHVQH